MTLALDPVRVSVSRQFLSLRLLVMASVFVSVRATSCYQKDTAVNPEMRRGQANSRRGSGARNEGKSAGYRVSNRQRNDSVCERGGEFEQQHLSTAIRRADDQSKQVGIEARSEVAKHKWGVGTGVRRSVSKVAKLCTQTAARERQVYTALRGTTQRALLC